MRNTRTVNRGDTFFSRVTPQEGDTFTAEILRHNPDVKANVRIRDSDNIKSAPVRAIWGRAGFPSEDLALRAAERQAFIFGVELGPEPRAVLPDRERE